MIKKQNGFNYNPSSSAIINEDDFWLYVRGTSNRSTKTASYFNFNFFSLYLEFERKFCVSLTNVTAPSVCSRFRAANAHPLCFEFEIHDPIAALCCVLRTRIAHTGNSFKSCLGYSGILSF